MPGSANFVGEFYILNGLFDAKIVFAIVAISGVAMSAYYALRLYQRTMHNRKPDGLVSREINWRDGVVLTPLVLCILGLALYPQLILKRTDGSVQRSVAAATQGSKLTSFLHTQPDESKVHNKPPKIAIDTGEAHKPRTNSLGVTEVTIVRPSTEDSE
jgi:NADH:ubiquinone oxidoreductase subunit 4 (subunit M)